MLVVASVVQTFHLTPYAVARSLASQQMGEDEQGPSSTILLFTLILPLAATYCISLYSVRVCHLSDYGHGQAHETNSAMNTDYITDGP